MILFPSIKPDYTFPSYFHPLSFEVYENGKCVGEVKIKLYRYKDTQSMLDDAEQANRYVYGAMQALSEDERFNENFKPKAGETPIIAYIERLFIYPEYRGNGYGAKCLACLSENIRNVTLTTPVAMTVFIEPQDAHTLNGETVLLTHRDQKNMKKQMKYMFTKAGFVFPTFLHPFCGYICHKPLDK